MRRHPPRKSKQIEPLSFKIHDCLFMKRISFYQVSPEPAAKLGAVSKSLENASIEPSLRFLVEIRVSQINGCVYCVELHSRQARQDGENQQRLDTLPVWQEAPFFTGREKAALAWAESLANVASTHAGDAEYEALKQHFSEKEMADLTYIIAVMNAWNRIAVGFRKMPD